MAGKKIQAVAEEERSSPDLRKILTSYCAINACASEGRLYNMQVSSQISCCSEVCGQHCLFAMLARSCSLCKVRVEGLHVAVVS